MCVHTHTHTHTHLYRRDARNFFKKKYIYAYIGETHAKATKEIAKEIAALALK